MQQTKQTPLTQGIKYAGSKLKILPFIVDIVRNIKGVRSVLDGFSGTTRVAQAFAQLGYSVTVNDIAKWSEVFGNCYLLSEKPNGYYAEMIAHLNRLQGYDGWFTEHYGSEAENAKRPFQSKNTRKLDAMRDEIDQMSIEWVDKCVLLTSLILAMDSVDSTLGHFVSYLSKWSARSYKDMALKLPLRFEHNGEHKVFCGDIFNTIKNQEFDLAYFDPPYGSNNDKMPPSRVRYASYYHLWTTIVLNDKPQLFGKANRRIDSRDVQSSSQFEEFRKDDNGNFLAFNALHKLINETQARYLLLSYSSGGRTSKADLVDIINGAGKLLRAVEIDYKRNVMANMSWTKQWINQDLKNVEYLFLLEKS